MTDPIADMLTRIRNAVRARHEVMRDLGYFDAQRFPWSGAPPHWTIRAWKAGWRYRVVHRRDRLVLHHGHRSIADQSPGEQRPPETFKMPVSFEQLLREEGLEPEYPAPLRRLLERYSRPLRDLGRCYAAPPIGRLALGVRC